MVAGENAGQGGAANLASAPGPETGPALEAAAISGIRIDRGGTWYYHNSPIGRMPLVKLFASVLRRERDGGYWLVTPAERGRIEDEDVPFVAVEMDVSGEGRGQILSFRTNLDERIDAGPEHRLRVETDPETGAPGPYIHVRGGLEARLARPVFYQLVELGRDEESRAGAISAFGAAACSFRWAIRSAAPDPRKRNP